VVGLLVCARWSRLSPAKTAESIEMPFGGGGADSCERQKLCIRWAPDPQGKGAILRDARPIQKHWQSLLWYSQQTG